MSLHLSRFGGGVALLGSADTRAVDEVAQADGYDIGARGALVCTSDATDYTMALDYALAPFARLYGFAVENGFDANGVLVVGEGVGVSGYRYIAARMSRTTGGASYIGVFAAEASHTSTPMPEGAIVTSAAFPGKFQIQYPTFPAPGNPELVAAYFVNIGARESVSPRSARGLYAVYRGATDPVAIPTRIGSFDALGTGAYGEYSVSSGGTGGTNAQQLYFRGIVTYNNHLLGWGFDASDTAYGDGPNRVMFCNLGQPLKWGNDNLADSADDRAFSDSDAIVLGDAGEIIRAALAYNGRLYFGTNRAMHFISGYGRDSFVTDGATPVMKAFNVIGPHAMIEGPDRVMYGVSDQGLWAFDGNGLPVALFQKLRDLQGASAGWFDTIWTRTGASGYPGNTNQDLVWMSVDWERQQVLTWIPFANAAGSGAGSDTVCIKYHPATGGFTRQVFPGVAYTAGGYFRREGQQPETRFLGTATTGKTSVQRYAHKATGSASPVMPTVLPVAGLGPYAPFGPDGEGVIKRAYLTVSWIDADALPIVFDVEATADDVAVNRFALTIGPAAPASAATGDLWLDTSQTDTNLGNGTAGATVAAWGGYLLKTFTTGRGWGHEAGMGATGIRATIALPLVRKQAARVAFTFTCTAASGRFALEGLGLDPGSGVETA